MVVDSLSSVNHTQFCLVWLCDDGKTAQKAFSLDIFLQHKWIKKELLTFVCSAGDA